MKLQYTLLSLLSVLITSSTLTAQEIPIEQLDMKLQPNKKYYSKIILKNEINNIQVHHVALLGNTIKQELMENDCKFIYLFIRGQGTIVANKKIYNIVPETIFLPNSIQHISIDAKKNDTLHFLKISSKLTQQDFDDLKTFPIENTQTPYFKRFVDCEAYTEPIKSPNTISEPLELLIIIFGCRGGGVKIFSPLLDRESKFSTPIGANISLTANGLVYACTPN